MLKLNVCNILECHPSSFFVPMCDLFLGVVVGELIYQLIIEYHLQREVQEEQREEKESSKFLIAQPIKMPV